MIPNLTLDHSLSTDMSERYFHWITRCVSSWKVRMLTPNTHKVLFIRSQEQISCWNHYYEVCGLIVLSDAPPRQTIAQGPTTSDDTMWTSRLNVSVVAHNNYMTV